MVDIHQRIHRIEIYPSARPKIHSGLPILSPKSTQVNILMLKSSFTWPITSTAFVGCTFMSYRSVSAQILGGRGEGTRVLVTRIWPLASRRTDVSWTCSGFPIIRTVLPAVRKGRTGRVPMYFSLRGALMRGVGLSMGKDVLRIERRRVHQQTLYLPT
jgi:hypothetical protein